MKNTGFEHQNGWMNETAVARALGVGSPHYVRRLPIPRTSLRTLTARYERNRYRVEDVQAYLAAHTTTPVVQEAS